MPCGARDGFLDRKNRIERNTKTTPNPLTAPYASFHPVNPVNPVKKRLSTTQVEGYSPGSKEKSSMTGNQTVALTRFDQALETLEALKKPTGTG